MLDSCQLTAQHKVATPVNWNQGEDVIIVPAVSNEEAKEKFPRRLESAQAVSADRTAAAIRPLVRAVRGRCPATPLFISAINTFQNATVRQVRVKKAIAALHHFFDR